MFCFFFSSRRRHTRFDCDWSSDVCSSDLALSGKSRRMLLHDAAGVRPDGAIPDAGVRPDGSRHRHERLDVSPAEVRSEEHTSEPSHSQISYAVFCLKKKKKHTENDIDNLA